MIESQPVKNNRNLGGKKGSAGKKGGKKGGKGKKDTDLGDGDNYYHPDPYDNHYGIGKKGGKGGKGYTGSTPPATPDGNGNTNGGVTDANTSKGSSDGSNGTGDSSNGTGGSSNGTGDSSNGTGDSSNGTGGSSNGTGGSSNGTDGSSNGTDGPSGQTGGHSIISSPAPTNPPTPQTTSGGDSLTGSRLTVQECQAISDGLGPVTGTAMNFIVETDVIHSPDADVPTVLAAFNGKLQQVVAPQMAGCENIDAKEVRKLLVLEGNIQNVKFGFTVVNKGRRCETIFSPRNKCAATDTKVAVYVYQDGERRALNKAFVGIDLSSTTFTSEINHARALATVDSRDVMSDIAEYVGNANAYGNLTSTGFVDANVTGVTFSGITNVNQTPRDGTNVANVAQEVGANDDGGMQLRGILPLAFGLVALVLLLMCVVKRRRNTTDTSQHVYLDDDEDWKSEDNTAEEHSLENGDDTEVNYELNVGGMDTVDVHRCNSALCDICNQRKKLEFLRVERSFASGLTDDAMKEYFDGGDLVAL